MKVGIGLLFAGSFVVIGCSATVSEGEAEAVASATQADTALTVAQAPNPSPACNGATGAAVQCLNAFFPSCMGNYTTSELLDALCGNTPNTAQNVITACVPAASLLNKVVQCGIVLPANLMAAYVNYIYDNSNPGQYQANGQTFTAGGIGPANQSECTVNGQPGQFQTSVLGTTCVPIAGGGGAPAAPSGRCTCTCSDGSSKTITTGQANCTATALSGTSLCASGQNYGGQATWCGNWTQTSP